MITRGSYQLLDALKKQVGFEDWHNRNKLGAELFIKGFFVEGGELPGWVVQRAHLLRNPLWPTATRVLWRPPALEPLGGLAQENMPARYAAASVPLLHLDLFECASRSLAHEFLVQLLGQFELPGMTLQEGAPAGDVHFSGPGSQVALFARGNVVLLLRNAGLSHVPIGELAATLDQSLTRRPDAPGPMAGPGGPARRAPRREVEVGAKVPLALPGDAPLSEGGPSHQAGESVSHGPMLKVFANKGDLLEENGQVFYRAKSPGAQELTVYAIYPRGVATLVVSRFSAK